MIAEKFAHLLYRNPKKVIAGFFLLLMASIFPALQIRTDFNLEGFYQEEDPVVKEYSFLEEEFGRDDKVIVVGYQQDDLVSREGIDQNRRLHEQLEDLPFIEGVRSLSQAERMINRGDQLLFTPYFEDEDRLMEEELLSKLSEDPFVSGFFINSDLNATALYID